MDRKWWPEIAGAIVVLMSRLLTMPRTFWEYDELLFASAVRKFEPLVQHPHQPGYPLYVGLAKAFAFLFGDTFGGMVALSVVACVIGYVFLARYAGAAAALIFYFSAGALVHLTLPLSDSAALMFLAMAFFFAKLCVAPATSAGLIAFALSCSAAIGTRPQLAIPLLPIFAVVVFRTREWKKIAIALAAFTALSLAWFLPLIAATGGWTRFVSWELHQASYVAVHDAAMSRGGAALRSLIAWFVIHPFGPKVIAAPLLLAAAFGTVVLISRRMFLPLVFGALHLGFALLVMEPADSVRYSLPHVMIFCIAIGAALGATRWRALPLFAACCAAAASLAYTWPLLSARTSRPSPPAAAASFANRAFAPNTVIAYDLNLRPHAEYLMPRFRTMPIDRALSEFYDRPEIPVVLFVNGDSHAADAHVFAWPRTDAYRILTRDLYERVTLAALHPAERYLPVSGVYALERTTGGEEWRWLQREARIRLPRTHGQRLTLAFALPHDAPWTDNVVHVDVNGHEVTVLTASKSAPSTATIAIPSGPVEVTLRCDRAFRPAEVLHNQDPRELAVELVAFETD